MKKGLLFVAVISAFSFASCKKDHACTCTSVTGSFTSTPNVTTYPKSTKAAARAHCLSSTTVNSGVTTTKTCTLD